MVGLFGAVSHAIERLAKRAQATWLAQMTKCELMRSHQLSEMDNWVPRPRASVKGLVVRAAERGISIKRIASTPFLSRAIARR